VLSDLHPKGILKLENGTSKCIGWRWSSKAFNLAVAVDETQPVGELIGKGNHNLAKFSKLPPFSKLTPERVW